jgi:hypothetical protein
MAALIGNKKAILPQYKAIYTARVTKRGMSELMKDHDDKLKLANYDLLVEVSTVTKAKNGKDLAKSYKDRFNAAVAAVNERFLKYGKDWSEKESTYLKQLIEELRKHRDDWGKVAEKLG